MIREFIGDLKTASQLRLGEYLTTACLPLQISALCHVLEAFQLGEFHKF
jgi:hypothetical protein